MRSAACWRSASPKPGASRSIVENKPGANNQIAAEYVTKAAPDGYTLLIGPEVTFVVNPEPLRQAAL